MVLNYLWIAFFLIAIIIGFVKLIFFGDTEIFKLMAEGTFDSAKAAVMDIALPLVGIMSLWLGFMRIGEKAGAINFLSRMVGPFFNKLFPEVPKNKQINIPQIKGFSGNDDITGQQLYRMQEIFTPTFQIVICCNSMPSTDEDDDATKRHLHQILFKSKFVDALFI